MIPGRIPCSKLFSHKKLSLFFIEDAVRGIIGTGLWILIFVGVNERDYWHRAVIPDIP